ncbi:unnamed protein product [Dovyalis caffra]|uniref:Uncharacterized protein n=1 Tax=Dovyalis caffra TaxID=77055 RepID=A0AAV1RB68_9ROSI|nr:unnamed protein product [Dovyalis caffra]
MLSAPAERPKARSPVITNTSIKVPRHWQSHLPRSCFSLLRLQFRQAWRRPACSKNVVVLFRVELLSAMVDRCPFILGLLACGILNSWQMQKPSEEPTYALQLCEIGDPMNSVDFVDFGDLDATAITHPREEIAEEMATENPEGLYPLVGTLMMCPCIPPSSRGPGTPLIEHINVVMNSDPSTVEQRASEVRPGGDMWIDFQSFVVLECYVRGLAKFHVKDGEFWSGIPVHEPRLGFYSWLTWRGSGYWKVDELKEQKAIIIEKVVVGS